MMTEILTDLSTPAVVKALEQNFYDLCWGVREHWPEAFFEDTGKQRRWITTIPLPFIFNATLSTQPPAGDETAQIQETIAFFLSKGKKEFTWWLAPGLVSSDWGRQLEAHGFALEKEIGMSAELDSLPASVPVPDGYQISRVEDAGSMKIWMKTFMEGYGFPLEWEPSCQEMMLATLHGPWMSYLATIDDQPVAASSVFYDAGVAGIMNVSTLKEWRGKGLGAAVTLQPLLDARSMGYQVGVLESSDLGYKVYQRLGFKDICRINEYHWQAK